MFRRLQEADCKTLSKQLLVYAHWRAGYYSWRGGGPFELAAGQTIDDIVQEAIFKACAGERKWDPEKGSLDVWLKDQIKSIMDHLANSATHRHETDTLDIIRNDGTGEESEGDVLELSPPRSAYVASAEEVVVRQEEVKEEFDLLFEAADGNEQLERMIEVVCWEGCEKDAEIAEAMGISVKEVYNLTRKLKRRVARKREQHGSPQQT